MERILHIPGCESMNRSNGINSFLMNVYRNINRDKYQFDFLVYGTEPGDYDNEIKSLGGTIYHVVRPGENLLQNVKQTYRIIKKRQYRIVHRHAAESLCWMDFLVAKLCGVKIRICHSHGSHCRKIWLHKIFYPLFIVNVTDYLACGNEAGRWLYGNKRKFYVIKNGIDTQNFEYNGEKRKILRNRSGIDLNAAVIGSVGRLSVEKNTLFLIDLFAELVKVKKDSICVIVGDGDLMNKVKCKVKELKLDEKVIFTGVSNDVQGWLSVMDVVVYPSLYEGFPVAVLESEANGVPSILSDKIPNEVDVTGLSRCVPLSVSPEQWAKEVIVQLESYKSLSERHKYKEVVRKAGYDIKQTAKDLEKYYDTALMKQKNREMQ